MSYIDLMKNVDMGSVIDEKKIFNVEKRMNIEFPIGYKEFIKTYNGAEGEIGENSYIVIWKIEEIAELNNEYGVSEFTPGLVYFGSDGGGMAYAFDMRNEKKIIVEFPMDSIHIEDAVYIADSFEGFIKAIYCR